ncbi:MAG: carboxypeptidase-like regulatory domain-containing protein [Verrucomicrobiae bacterium]|nr:carboxypeptidase-like regulatory domain-containing protein [Verrucomicrobiae bacterium]
MKTKLLFFLLGVSALILLKFNFLTDAIAAEKTQINRPPPGYNPSNYFLPMRPGLYPTLEDFMALAIKTPIYFWGKAVDEQGNPIADAKVRFGILSKLSLRSQEERFTKTDKDGLFSLTDAKGASLSIDVSKEGYYQIKESNGKIDYCTPPTTKDRPIPTPDNPSIFILKKKGIAEPLLESGLNKDLPTNGTPVEINLRNIKGIVKDSPDLIIQCWINGSIYDSNGNFGFPWKARLTMPGGGLIERKNEFDFVAPETGYQSVIDFEHQYPPTGTNRYTRSINKDYFLKLPDGKYARAEIDIEVGPENYILTKSLLNPSGSRNLEYDETKIIRPSP